MPKLCCRGLGLVRDSNLPGNDKAENAQISNSPDDISNLYLLAKSNEKKT